MSIITVLALTFVTLLLVVVLAACASFPSRIVADMDAPDSDWSGMTTLSLSAAAKEAAGNRPGAKVTRLSLKVHSLT